MYPDGSGGLSLLFRSLMSKPLHRSVARPIRAAVGQREPFEHFARDGELQAYRHYGFFQSVGTLREKRFLGSLWELGEASWKNWA
jgi:NDP-sugar pyrophosphorylase family protein